MANAIALSGESAQAAPPKRFKDYEPGFVHVDIKYLPQMPDETARRYLYVGIDRATRWVFVRIYADMETTSAVDFVNRLHEAAPMRIDKLLTDNGACFTDRFQRKSRTPSGKHHFDVRCRALGIEHRLCPPRHPQTNGLVERFNGRIAEITAQTRFHSAAELEQTLMNYVKVYNTRIPQRALDHHTPLDALKSWRAKSPDLFKKRPKNLPGLDRRGTHGDQCTAGPGPPGSHRPAAPATPYFPSPLQTTDTTARGTPLTCRRHEPAHPARHLAAGQRGGADLSR